MVCIFATGQFLLQPISSFPVYVLQSQRGITGSNSPVHVRLQAAKGRRRSLADFRREIIIVLHNQTDRFQKITLRLSCCWRGSGASSSLGFFVEQAFISLELDT
ncbi:unnamed protein product [Calypogeia fissa]